jgi:hypothetical protein
MYPLSLTQVSEPGRTQPVRPPTPQILKLAAGSALWAGRSAVSALDAARRVAAEPSKKVLTSAMADLIGLDRLSGWQSVPNPPWKRRFRAMGPNVHELSALDAAAF